MAPQRVVVFAGDSVTDCGHLSDRDRLGDGYVRRLASSPAFESLSVVNSGISGDRTSDLLERWESDVLAVRPDVVSIMIGINDVWRRYDSGDPTSVDAFVENYRAMLSSLHERSITIVMVEPFVIPTNVHQRTWRDDLDPKILAIHELAVEFSATLVPAHSAMNELAVIAGTDGLAPDGVHPSPAGHESLAKMWLRHAASRVS